MRALATTASHLATTLLPPAAALLRQLAQAALWGTLFALAVWLLCRLAPRLPAGVRCALWWLASLKLLLGLLWPAPLTLPLLPPAFAATAGGWLAPAPAARGGANRGESLAPARAAAENGAARTMRPVDLAATHGPIAAQAQPTIAQGDAIAALGPPRMPLVSAALPPAPALAVNARAEPAPVSGNPRPGVATRQLPAHWESGTPRPGIATLPLPARSPAVAKPAPASPWWALALAALWLVGVARQLALTAGELRRVRAFLARSAPVCDERLLRLAGDLGSSLGLGAVELRTAPPGAELPAPLTAGALHPVVVLPEGASDRLSAQELAMTLGHELMHARRRDLLWGWVPAAAARLFFFLPPAALAAREHALAREAACDAAVLRLLGAAPSAYGRLLVRLGVHHAGSRPRAGRSEPAPAAAIAGGAATSLRQLKRRLEMLQHQQHPLASPPRPARLRRLGLSLLVLVALAALVPMRIAAVTPAPAAPASVSQAAITSAALTLAPVASASIASVPTSASAAPAPIASVPGASAPVGNSASMTSAPIIPASDGPAPGAEPARQAMAATPPSFPDGFAVPPAPPAPPTPPAPPAPPDGTTPPTPPIPPVPPNPPVPPEPPAGGHRAYSHDGVRPHSRDGMDHRRSGDPYVLLQGCDEVTMSGDTADVERARQQQRLAGGGDLLWIRHAGREYVIRDAATLSAVREIFRPQAELGARQGELGAQQGELGARQGELGSRQGALGAQQGKLGAEQARLAAEQARLTAETVAGDDRASGAREQRRDQLVEQQVQLAGEMRRLGEQQRELGRQQRELGEQQRRLGDQQRELGRQQRSAAHEADAKLHALLDQAIAGGTAKDVR